MAGRYVCPSEALLNRARDTAAMRARSLLLVVAVATFAATSANASVARTVTATGVIAYGYPYTHRCPGAGIAKKVDRWGMYMCNCTSYVAWALQANHQRTGWFIRGSMDAWNWPNVARRSRLRVGTQPLVGDVAVWPKVARPFGHVAYVIGVEPNGNVDVSEYNFPFRSDSGNFRFDIRTHVSARGATFIEVPGR
jgi:surface antigen